MLRKFLAILLLIPLPVLAYHVPTQAPYGVNASNDSTAGTFTIGILGSDGAEDSPPENYTIFFSLSSGITETNSFCVTTSFGHQTNTWQYYTFSLDDLKYYFNDPAGNNIYYRVRANNETDNSVSTLTNETSWNLYAGSPFDYNQENWSAPTGTNACNPYVVTTTTTTITTTTIPPAVPDDATNISVNYQGKDVYFAWEYTDGNTLVNEFHINYSYDNATWERVIITDTTARTYTLDYTNIQTGTFYWTFGVCGDLENGESCTDSDSNNFETTEYVPPTTTTLPPPPPPPPTPPPPPPTVTVTMEDGSESEYKQSEIDDGTVERDNQRKKNEELYGCYITDAALERGDCDIPEEVIEEDIIIDDELYEEISGGDTEGELPSDDIVVLEMDDEYEDEVIVELTEEEIVALEKEMEIDAKELELLEEETYLDLEELSEKELEEFVEVILEIEEIIEEFNDVEIIEVVIEDIPEDIIVIIEEEVIEDDAIDVVEEIVEEVLVEPIQKDVEERPVEDLTKEEVAIEVAEIEEVIEIPIVEEDATEEEVAEAIIEYVEELETEEVIEVLEEVNDVGVQNLEEVSEEVQEVIQAVVEEAIEDVEDLTPEQVEVVAEVLQVETEDVEIIAEAVQSDVLVAEAVEEYVERAVENADVEDYTLADVVTEVQYEAFIENPLEVLIDLDNIADINLSNISNDMTQDQKEKAQEVVVPVILTRIASMAAFIFRRSL